jgi:hypothetical protein
MAILKNKPLVALYAALLHLYPSSFRRRFGQEMLAAFSDLLNDFGPLPAISVLLREFLRSLFREHSDDPSSLVFAIRALLCPLPPMILYAIVLANVRDFDEFFFFTFWLICILASFWQTGCRGRAFLARTMLASLLGVLFPLALINLYHPMIPGLISLATPLALLAVTVGLIFAAYARVIMEGLTFKSIREAAI